ncbi:MAG TPA: methylenetetrahydrofolate reductase [NAD(P)H] [Clostridiales bacterium]|jgi:methylenetetrahydrofolate reductase (NADPH)|nr:methylenetetrahydrofolate reductase [NAD(P)H] [Clostridiales bacterium]
MFIKDKFIKKNKVISLEIFPPNSNMTLKQLLDVIDDLAVFRPDYISVTYGASGNANNDYTIDIAEYIKEKYTIEAMPHLTCITSKKEKVDEILQLIIKKDLKNVLALRGDKPKDGLMNQSNRMDFTYASDLIEHIRSSELPVSIAAACYPEGHIEAPSLNEDIRNLKTKVDKGVDFLITQLFFDNERFYDFKDRLTKNSINTPLTVGIMPITNVKQIKRIVSLSGASVPPKLKLLLDKYENDNLGMFQAGIEYACQQMDELDQWKVNGFHLYVMNKPEIAKMIYKNMNW